MVFSDYKNSHENLINTLFEKQGNQDAKVIVYGDNKTNKEIMQYVIKLIPHMCGDDVDLKIVLDKIQKYCEYEIDENYSYKKEKELIQEVLINLYQYEETIQKQYDDVNKAIESLFKGVDTNNMGKEAKASDVKYFTTKQYILNSACYSLIFAYLFEHMITGVLPKPNDEELKSVVYGTGAKDDNPNYSAAISPIFTHAPLESDINEKDIEDFPALKTLKKLIKYNPSKVIELFADNDDGNAYVKLYLKNEDGKYAARYVKVSKFRSYSVWNLLKRHECAYPGILKEAFLAAGIDAALSDEKEVLATLCGPEYVLSEVEVEKNEKFYETHCSKDVIYEYIRVFHDIFVTMLASSSMFEETSEEIENLAVALRIMTMYLPTLYDCEKTELGSYLKDVKTASDAYEEKFGSGKESKEVMRSAVCKTVDTLYEQYNKSGSEWQKPYTYIVDEFTNKCARQLLVSVGKTTGDEEVQKMVDALGKSKTFTSSMNNLTSVGMNTASEEDIANCIEKYQSESKKA